MITNGIVEQHIHGTFGIDFMKCKPEDVNLCAKKLLELGITAFFPTIMTDDLDIIKTQIAAIKEAKSKQKKDEAEILGIHLEGPFINPEKSGIHDKKFILPLDVNVYKKIEDEIIKIVTVAPELDIDGSFIKYLNSKNIKISAGHCTGYNFENIFQVTHLYNAMGTFTHRGSSTVISALTNDNIYTEIIADSMHVSDEVLKITFKQKPEDKILLISDALPLAHSTKEEIIFAGQKIYNKEGKAVNADGTLAGSSMLLPDIIKNLVSKKLLTTNQALKYSGENQFKYHKTEPKFEIIYDEGLNVKDIKQK